MKKNEKNGYDAVLNAPMSASLLLSVATPEEREEILAAHTIRYDGMGSLSQEIGSWLDIMIEPGNKAPFQDMDPKEVEATFGKPTRKKSRR